MEAPWSNKTDLTRTGHKLVWSAFRAEALKFVNILSSRSLECAKRRGGHNKPATHTHTQKQPGGRYQAD